MDRPYLSTRQAAERFGVCPATFRKMVAALPERKRPKPIALPGVACRRWRVTDLDTAFAQAANATSWDQTLEGEWHVEKKNRRQRGGMG